MTRESEPVMGEALRLFVFLFLFVPGPERVGRRGLEGAREAASKEERGIPSMVAKRMMGYRGSREVRRGEEGRGVGGEGRVGRGWRAEDGMRNSRWLSLRCLYTRGSCMAVGHISVSRERGAPPKNQIECKNRINSSWRVESYVGPVGARWALSLASGFFLFGTVSFSLSLAQSFFPVPVFVFAGQGYTAASHDSTSRRGRSPPIFPLILLVCRHESYAVCRAYEGSALYRQPKRSRPRSAARTPGPREPQNNFTPDTDCPPTSRARVNA